MSRIKNMHQMPLTPSDLYNRSLSFWTMSFHYLNLVEAALGETIKQENTWVVISEHPIDWEKYDETTKWSDFKIFVPILYNFYHAIELLLKGFVLLKKTDDSVKLDHDIERLLAIFNKQYSEQCCLTSALNKYIGVNIASSVLSAFFKENDCSSNRFYELLRYPSDLRLKKFFSYMQLKYNAKQAISFFEELQGDIAYIRRCSVSLGRSFECRDEHS